MAGGILAALSGLGGGSVVVPILNLGFKMDIKRAKAISLGMILLSTAVITLFNMLETPRLPYNGPHWGYLVWPVALPLSIGVAVASPLGVMVGKRLPSKVISYIFAIFLALVIIKKAAEWLALS